MRTDKIKALLNAALVACALWAPAQAQESASFLKIHPGSRGQSLGGAVTALPSGSDSLFSNPAGLTGLSQREIGMTHAFYLGDSYDALSLAFPLGSSSELERRDWFGQDGRKTATAFYSNNRSRGVLGVGATRLGYGSLEARDASRKSQGSFNASDWLLSLGYAQPLPGGLSAGVAVKRIESRIADASAGATAFDAGLGWAAGGPWRGHLGAAARNVGEDLKYSGQSYPLPLTFAAGISLEPIPGFLVSTELQRRPKGNQTIVGLGTEYRMHPIFALRAGYLKDQVQTGLAWVQGFSGGFGLNWRSLSLDYAVAPYGRLGNVQTVSFKTHY